MISSEEYLKNWPPDVKGQRKIELKAKQRFLKEDLNKDGRAQNGNVVIRAGLDKKRMEKLEDGAVIDTVNQHFSFKQSDAPQGAFTWRQPFKNSAAPPPGAPGMAKIILDPLKN